MKNTEQGKMPNRVIKDTIFTSPSLAALEQYYQDQWSRWILLADDWGCFNADPEVIKGIAYPKRKETIKQIINIRDTFYNAGMLFIWTTTDRRTWGYFVNWDIHQFCNALCVDEDGKYTKHRRKTPEPPQAEIEKYLSDFDKVRHDSTKVVNPNPNPKHNPNPKDTSTIKEFMEYYNSKLKEKGWIKQNLQLTYARSRLIEDRTKHYSLDDLKKCVDNFVHDEWEDRHKYIDPKYCIGIIGGRDLLERWLNADLKPKKEKDSWDIAKERTQQLLKKDKEQK